MTVAGKIDEPQVGVVPVQPRQGAKGGESVPASVLRTLVKAGYGFIELDQVERAVACQVEKLRAPTVLLGERGFLPDEFYRPEPRNGRFQSILAFEGNRADVALVEPHAGLLGQNARHPLAVQVEPLIARAVQPVRQVFEAFRIDSPDLFLDGCLAVLEFQRRQRFLQIAAFRLALVAALGNGCDKRGYRVPLPEVLGVIADVPIDEICGTYQAVLTNFLLIREVMEHQDALA